MTITRRKLIAAGASVAGIASVPALVSAQEKFEVKVANFVPPNHFLSQWLVKWGEGLEKRSAGRLTFKHFPSAQMGPTPKHYDFAYEGTAEVSFFLHGATPGRFPLTELAALPFTVGSAEIGTKVVNDPELRGKYLDGEHKGVKVLMLFTTQPGSLHMVKKPVRTLEDFKGLRLRFATTSIRDFISALGATPVGVPATELAEQLQKGTLDGAFLDYGGAGVAWKLNGIVKSTTEMYFFVASFGLVANEAWFNKLPKDLQQMVMESITGKEKEMGEGWDALDVPGKKALLDGGAETIRLSKADEQKVREIATQTNEAALKALEAKGLPARTVYTSIKALADKHAKTSKSFWT
jgi:TRAP-type transport system periplasmic protein